MSKQDLSSSNSSDIKRYDHITFDAHNKNLHNFFDSASDLILVVGVDDTILFANEACKKSLGYVEKDLNHLKLRSVLHKYYAETAYDNLKRVSDGEAPERFNTTFVAKTGRKVEVSGSFSCNYENGKPVAYTGIFFDNTEKRQSENARRLYYSISNLVIETANLDNLLEKIHSLLKQYIEANNFHLALHNEGESELNFPYYVDELLGGKVDKYSRAYEKGLTEYVIEKKEPVFLYEEDILKLIEQKEMTLLGDAPKVWLGVPLSVGNRIIGAIAVKSHSDRNKYKRRELDLLDFISGQIALTVERKQYEDKINDQRARLNAIFESSTHLIWSMNRKMGLTSFNHNYANAVFNRYETIPIIDPNAEQEHYFLAENHLHRFVEKSYKSAFKGNPQHFEIFERDKNDNIIWREVFLNPIFLPDGNIEEISGIAHDITEKKMTEDAIKESEGQFRDIFESFQDIYYRTNLRGEVLLISPSVKEMSGYEQEEVLGTKVNDFFTIVHHQNYLIKQLLKEGKVRNYEAKLKKKNGELLDVNANIRIIYNENKKPIAIDGVVRDVTYLTKVANEMEESKNLALHSLKVKEQFLANMSHEIRTPMNGITGMIDLLSKSHLDEEQTDYVDTIKKSSKVLLEILNDILDLSKLEAGKMELKPVAVEINDTVAKIHDLFALRASEKGVRLRYHLDESVPAYIQIDETRLLQVLSNLISNAIKFTDHGNVSTAVSVEGYEDDKVRIRVDVKDTGIGIEKDDLSKLFKNFSQLDTSMKKSYAGTGLGLAISRELIHLMNGDIFVSSELGKGSTFSFTFLVNTATKEAVETHVQQIDNQLNDYSFKEACPVILVVDDNRVNRKVASTILIKADCKVELASDGFEAIDMIKKKDGQYDMVFMDIQMPKMDGIEAYKRIKELAITTVPPVIAMTAYSMKEDEKKMRDVGMNDYLPKPITSSSILQKVAHWLHLPQEAENSNPVLESENSIEFVNYLVVNQLKKIGGVEMVIDVFNEFEEETTALLKEANSAVQTKNYNAFKSVMHTIKGSAGTIGLLKISKKAEDLERKIKNKEYHGVESGFEDLKTNFIFFTSNKNKLIESD
ncbi:MAG: PAS domain S-box protein [Cyclobacteriaceae bacterium]